MAPKKSLSHRDTRPASKAGPSRWRSPESPSPVGPAHGSPSVGGGAAIAWPDTLRAKGRQALQRSHLRHRPIAVRAPRLHFIALDTSGSMQRGGRLAWAKGHAAWLIEQAACAGDDVALVCFGGRGVELLLPPGPARRSSQARVRPVGGGGGTPLAAALAASERLLRQFRMRNRGQGGCETWLWLLTDGRSLEQPTAPPAADHIVIIDFDASPGAPGAGPGDGIGRCATWARLWGAEHRPASSPIR